MLLLLVTYAVTLLAVGGMYFGARLARKDGREGGLPGPVIGAMVAVALLGPLFTLLVVREG